jgi:hypothetical protein
MAEDEDITRPIILYVKDVDTTPPTLEYMERRRITVIDLEFNRENAEQLRDLLSDFIKRENLATKYVRLYGVLVVG